MSASGAARGEEASRFPISESKIWSHVRIRIVHIELSPAAVNLQLPMQRAIQHCSGVWEVVSGGFAPSRPARSNDITLTPTELGNLHQSFDTFAPSQRLRNAVCLKTHSILSPSFSSFADARPCAIVELETRQPADTVDQAPCLVELPAWKGE